MITFLRFTGINNQQLSSQLEVDPKTGATPLAAATNVDLDLAQQWRRRMGYAQADTGAFRNLWQAAGFLLASKDGDLINVDTGAVLYANLSDTLRTWYTNLPDGRTTFSNGTICGITDGTVNGTTKWGAPVPASAGTITPTAGGSLKPGRYRAAATHVRVADGLESGPAYAAAFDLVAGNGTVVWTGLPAAPAGHRTNVYLSSHNDDTLYLAATTTGTTTSFAAANDTLQLECKTDFCIAAPAGICTAFWRGRTLMAVGSVLLASRPQQWELFDYRVDFKQFSGDITLVQPVDGGIWVGTEYELAFLQGTQFDQLVAMHAAVSGAVVLGSGVAVDGRYIKGGGAGPAMICIANGYLVAGMGDGSARALTDNVYRTDAEEVIATFRMQGEIPQYIAIEQ